MTTPIQSILRAATRGPDEPLNILSMATHERFESCWGLTPHRFYVYRERGMKEWKTEYAPVPHNYTLLPYNTSLPTYVDFDVVLSQSKFAQYSTAKRFAQELGIPLISLEHTLPHPNWSPIQTEQVRRLRGNVNVFLSEFSREAWGWEGDYKIVGPGIDDNIFVPKWYNEKHNIILSVVNDWINRDAFCGFRLWQQVTKDLPVFVLGDTPGLSKAAKNTQELIDTYQSCKIFLNTSLVSTAPFTLLEAMACGMAVVTTATSMIPQIVQNGVNGFCTNDPTELRKYCRMLLEDNDLCQRLGREARRTIEERYSFRQMAANWNKVFYESATI